MIIRSTPILPNHKMGEIIGPDAAVSLGVSSCGLGGEDTACSQRPPLACRSVG